MLAIGCACSGAAWSFGAAGHETVGALADAVISGTPAAARVQAILGTSLKTAAVWADCVKGVNAHAGTFEYGATGRYPECAPYETAAGIAEMVAYVERNWSACRPPPGADPCHKQYHYSDVAIERERYAAGEAGTSDHDVEAALRAAIVYLKTGTSTPPIAFASQREALFVLTHLVGDIHQPLHVGAIYLDTAGLEVDPDAHGLDPATETRGGNLLMDGARNLHAEWDGIITELDPAHLGVDGVALARATPRSSGPVEQWPDAWATDTLAQTRQGFAGLRFDAENMSSHTWAVSLPAGYARARDTIQRQQLLKAGGRLAQVLEAIFPSVAASNVRAEIPADLAERSQRIRATK